MDTQVQFGTFEIVTLIFYFGVTAICLLETILENGRSARRFDLWFVSGLCISALWPLILVALMLRYLWRKNFRRNSARRRAGTGVKTTLPL